jgi:hypothetical protein
VGGMGGAGLWIFQVPAQARCLVIDYVNNRRVARVNRHCNGRVRNVLSACSMREAPVWIKPNYEPASDALPFILVSQVFPQRGSWARGKVNETFGSADS